MGILELLRERARQRAKSHPKDDFLINSVALVENLAEMRALQIVNHSWHIKVTTATGQGLCYYDAVDDPAVIWHELVGANALDVETPFRAVNVALLDAVFSRFERRPWKSYTLCGEAEQEAEARVRAICENALLLFEGRRPRNGSHFTVLDVGVVGGILAYLAEQRGVTVSATDFNVRLVGRRIHGTRVEHGSQTLRLVAEADLVIATGMTIANATLDAIIDAAREHSTALVLMAKTGAHFAPEYCDLGVDMVVAEPFAFGTAPMSGTTVDVYRRGIGPVRGSQSEHASVRR